MDGRFKVWFEVANEEVLRQKEDEIRDMGYDFFDIHIFRYQGADGKFHREIFVFNDVDYSCNNNEDDYPMKGW